MSPLLRAFGSVKVKLSEVCAETYGSPYDSEDTAGGRAVMAGEVVMGLAGMSVLSANVTDHVLVGESAQMFTQEHERGVSPKRDL